MINKKILILLVVLLITPLCIKLDFFLFEADPISSVEKDYHGLPLYSGKNPPSWIDEEMIEREIYLSVPSAQIIDTGDLKNHREYIHGVFLPAPESCSTDSCPLIENPVTFLYTHGNSGNMYRYWYRAVALWNMGANVFIFTYRGYGLSKGEATRGNIKYDSEIAAKYLRSRSDVDTSRIIVYGYSMGGITASHLAGSSPYKNRFAGVILESALDSPEDITEFSLGTEFPGGFFFDDSPFNGPDFIKNISIPVLHIHGSQDEKIILRQAEHYYDVLKDRDDYKHHIGKTSEEPDMWLAKAGHRNVSNWTFGAEKHIPDYYNDAKNPNKCCTHPNEFLEEENEAFLKDIGNTTPQDIYNASNDYKRLIVDWVLSLENL